MSEPRRALRRNRSIYQVHYGLPRAEPAARPLAMPTDPPAVRRYEKQVAGHRGSCDKRYLGLLQCNGTVLKPIIKESQRREVEFYEELAAAEDPDLVEFRNYVPKYYGCRKFTYNGFEQDYIVLEDLVAGMLEPCIMDVKVGRQTWDHLASPEKVAREREKYRLCKEQFGFCIPGFQVHELASGRRAGYDKAHGKRLHGAAVKDALRKFLNGSAGRPVLLALLAALWRLQRWAARQRRLRLAACSLLLAYDAAALRRAGAPRRASLPAPAPAPAPAHSADHDYERELSRIRREYRATLDQLTGAARSEWGVVKVIDFAHAYPAEAPAACADFADGVRGLVALLEQLLAEAGAAGVSGVAPCSYTARE